MDEQEQSNQPSTKASAEVDASSSLTRRQWLLKLGEVAVLSGFSGVAAGDLAGAHVTVLSTSGDHSLPPGLYEPSAAHMAHALTRDQRYVNPPPGSETEYITPVQGLFEPAFFSSEDFQVVRQSVLLLLNTAGRSEPAAGISAVSDKTVDEIAQWIDLVVHEATSVRHAATRLSAQHRTLAAHYYGEETVRRLESDDEQKTWREGLAWLREEAAKLSAHSFLDLTEAQQAELFSSVGDSFSDKHSDAAGRQFYRALKRRIIEGYYTSQSGLKELDYQGNTFRAESRSLTRKLISVGSCRAVHFPAKGPTNRIPGGTSLPAPSISSTTSTRLRRTWPA